VKQTYNNSLFQTCEQSICEENLLKDGYDIVMDLLKALLGNGSVNTLAATKTQQQDAWCWAT
jgi:hypothetical protein